MTITIGRRELIAALGGAVAWPHAAHTQQPKVPTIGALVKARKNSGGSFGRDYAI
jgi:hypothetical protein